MVYKRVPVIHWNSVSKLRLALTRQTSALCSYQTASRRRLTTRTRRARQGPTEAHLPHRCPPAAARRRWHAFRVRFATGLQLDRGLTEGCRAQPGFQHLYKRVMISNRYSFLYQISSVASHLSSHGSRQAWGMTITDDGPGKSSSNRLCKRAVVL